jgi:Na+/melibiose symporter-like transporter
MGLAVGLAMTLLALAATAGTLRRGRSAPPAPRPAGRPSPLADARLSLGNRSFRILFGSATCFFLAVAVNASLAIHFLTHVAGIDDGSSLAALQLAFFGSGGLGILVWLRLARSIEKHRLYVAGTLGLAAVLALAWGVVTMTGAHLVTLLALQALGGFFGSVVWFLPASMVADVVDEDESRGGRRREGSFFGCLSLGQQVALGVSLLVTGFLLDVFAGLAPGLAARAPETASRIGILACLLPAALLVLAALIARRYDLGEARLAAIEVRLQRTSPGARLQPALEQHEHAAEADGRGRAEDQRVAPQRLEPDVLEQHRA